MKRIPGISHKNSLKKSLLSGLVPLMLLSACGGGTDDSATPTTGAALPGANNGETAVVTDTVINGRVADGYLQGATVCIDVNENGACDTDEPSVMTGEGGRYQLDKPAVHADKPIIASVPAEAIDEDTGEAIGKALLLSTPADRPDFISPITTLVHQEIKKNPTLTTDDAENTVLNELGLADKKSASLFTDYVAEQNSSNEEDKENYRYLHQTARVIASMMDDIRDRVEAVAATGGHDFVGDDTAREALHQLVTQEIRKLLPEISLAVAEKINKQAAEQTGSEPVAITEEVDPDKVAENLRPSGLDKDVVDKIDAIRNESEARKVAMESLLKEGIYWIEADCAFPDQHCYADYGHISVTGDDNLFTEQQYKFDLETGNWIKRVESEEDGEPFDFALVDGKWVAAGDNEPAGAVEFLADGGALLKTGNSEVLVYATAANLADTSVAHHLLKGDFPYELLDDIDKSALFPADSVAHRIYINRQTADHFLFNWPSEDEDYAEQCDEFGGNCNVLDTEVDGQIIPVTSLDSVLESSLQGFNLYAVTQHQKLGLPIDVKLEAGNADAAGLPTEGSATWLVANPDDYGQTYPAPGECDPNIDLTQQPNVELLDGQAVTEAETLYIPEQGPEGQDQYNPCQPPIDLPPEHCGQILQLLDDVGQQTAPPDECVEPGLLPEPGFMPRVKAVNEEKPVSETPLTAEDRVFATSRWQAVNIDGIRMIQIKIPVAVKHSIDIEGASAFLLIEHEGYVRRGATISDAAVSDQATYSLPAFETLEIAVKSYLAR